MLLIFKLLVNKKIGVNDNKIGNSYATNCAPDLKLPNIPYFELLLQPDNVTTSLDNDEKNKIKSKLQLISKNTKFLLKGKTVQGAILKTKDNTEDPTKI